MLVLTYANLVTRVSIMIKCPNCNSKKIKHYPDGIAERYETAFIQDDKGNFNFETPKLNLNQIIYNETNPFFICIKCTEEFALTDKQILDKQGWE